MTPLLVLRIGYMARYDGPGEISGGGSYVEEHGVGGEVFNFKPSRGKCYGYAMSRHFAGVDLNQLDDSQSWEAGGELAGVDVVFIARRPAGGQVVVGWYRGATVFHKQYRVRHGVIAGMKETERQFLCITDAANATLLAEPMRDFEVPSAPAGYKGFPGQSNVWYPKPNIGKPGVAQFVTRLRLYLDKGQGVYLGSEPAAGGGAGKNGRSTKPDSELNARIEKAAVTVATRYYEAQGFTVKSVEQEKLGWDLEICKGSRLLYVEVKGTAGPVIVFMLTPNEYANLQMFSPKYRVFVVCDALDLDKSRAFELFPSKGKGGVWELHSRKRSPSVFVPLVERTAASGVEVIRDPD